MPHSGGFELVALAVGCTPLADLARIIALVRLPPKAGLRVPRRVRLQYDQLSSAKTCLTIAVEAHAQYGNTVRR
jgi:hypothetical protein